MECGGRMCSGGCVVEDVECRGRMCSGGCGV